MLRVEDQLQFVVWPKGARSGGDKVIVTDGASVNNGDVVDGVGLLLPVERLAQWPDGYWGSTVGFCDPKARRVVVFDSVNVTE